MKQVCLNPLGSLKYPWKIGSLLFLLFNLYISSSFPSSFPLPPSLPSLLFLLFNLYISSSSFPFPPLPLSLLFLFFFLFISSSSSPFPLPLPFLSPSPSLPRSDEPTSELQSQSN